MLKSVLVWFSPSMNRILSVMNACRFYVNVLFVYSVGADDDSVDLAFVNFHNYVITCFIILDGG